MSQPQHAGKAPQVRTWLALVDRTLIISMLTQQQQHLQGLRADRLCCNCCFQSPSRQHARSPFRSAALHERRPKSDPNSVLHAQTGVIERNSSLAASDIWVHAPPGAFADVVESIPTGLQLTFLGTAGDEDRHGRRRFSLVLRTPRSCLLFDCGEDTQRALLQAAHVRPSRITRIFISSLDGDQVCGLPGMLCTISAAREKGHDMADVPLHVYGPRGLAQYLDAMLRVSATYLLMPVVIHELTMQPPDLTGWQPHELAQWGPDVEQINRRARLYVCMLPPDQLNPAGHYDGSQTTMLNRRAKRGGRLKGSDARAGTLPLELPKPGDPTAPDLQLPDATWTIRSDDDYTVTASPLQHDSAPCIAYTFVEADRSGMLDPKRAIALGVKPGRAFADLKAGCLVKTAAGDTVQPSEVLGPSRPGRRLLILGEGQQPSAPEIAAGCDVIVAPASYKGESVAATAAALAAQLGAKQLILARHAIRLTQPPDTIAGADVAAAKAALQGGNVVSALDLGIINLPRPEPAMAHQP